MMCDVVALGRTHPRSTLNCMVFYSMHACGCFYGYGATRVPLKRSQKFMCKLNIISVEPTAFSGSLILTPLGVSEERRVSQKLGDDN